MKKINEMTALTLSMLCLMSCGSAPSQKDDDNGKQSVSETDSADTEESGYIDDLGEYDFGGVEFYIDASPMSELSFYNSFIDVETIDADILNDAVYKRNRACEDRFNFVLKQVCTAEGGDEAATFRRLVMADDASFDAYMLGDTTTTEMIKDGLIVPYDDIPEINLEKPYWQKNLTGELSMAGKHYVAVGDLSLSSYDFTHLLLFNKKMHEDLGLENPYDLVLNNEWTMEKMGGMMKAATRDLNGDTVMDENDCWGYCSQAKQVLPGFWIGAGVKSVLKTEDDLPTFNLAGDSRFSDVIDRIYSITQDAGTWFKDVTQPNFDTTSRDMFTNEKSLFLDSTFFNISLMRGMETDFGILPYPMFDGVQKNYYSRVEGGVHTAVIPRTNTRLEMTGVIIESLTAESARTVIPAYFEKSLKVKGARDDESAQMLDIIADGRIYDLGDTLWCSLLRDNIFREMFSDGKKDLASRIAKIEEKVSSSINETIDAFKALENE